MLISQCERSEPVNIQIFGKTKCFDTKKAERYFKERGIKFQRIDLIGVGLSRGEFTSVKAAVGLDAMIDNTAPDVEILKYLAHETDREEKLFENPSYIKTPIVRNGKKATIGYNPEIWKEWEK
jgi:arsenate reductase-like glutaredoxin family protein